MTDGNSAAFSRSGVWIGDDERMTVASEPGLTKREYFAAMAMQGLISDPQNVVAVASVENENIGSFAVRFADDLIKALNAK